MLYGVHSVREALKAGRRTFFKIYVSEGKTTHRYHDVLGIARSHDIPVETPPPGALERHIRVGRPSHRSADHHQGISASVSPYPLVSMPEIVDAVTHGDLPMVLLLDHIVDPQNLGALIRTALSVGTDGVFIPKDRSASPTPTVSRISAGALEHIRMSIVTNLVHTIKALKQRGFWIMGLNPDAMDSIYTADFLCPLALVIGGEERGIRSLVKKHCDALLSIPQSHKIDSLNASVAGAVAMYEVFRQRFAGRTFDDR
jgi:23S rRNA (guanosine2251-2'-O)-methyltransferase